MAAQIFYAGACGFVSGVFLRSFFIVSDAVLLLVLLIVASWLLISFWYWMRYEGASLLVVAGVFLLLCVLGVWRMDTAIHSISTSSLSRNVDEQVTLTGAIMREPDTRATTQHLTVTTNAGERVLAITDPYQSFSYGDVVTLRGELTAPEPFETELGRTFNYPGYLRAQGIAYMMLYPEVETVGARGSAFLSHLFIFKAQFMTALERVLPEPAAGLGEGLLLGEKKALGETREEVFRETGIIHIVVLSGYNVMLVVAFVMYGLIYFFGVRVRAVVGIAAITVFALLVGPSPTVLRASVMASLLLLANATGQTYVVLRALVCAGVVMILINPYLLSFDTGFQLSFLATAGLILLAPRMIEWFQFVPAFLGAREFLVATLATQIFVLPLLLYQIGEFSVVAVVVNVLVLPMVALSMLGTALTGAAAMVSTALGEVLAYPTYATLMYIILLAEWFAALPFASFVVPAFPFWGVVISYSVLGLIAWRLSHKSKDTIDRDVKQWTLVSEDSLFEAGKR